MVWLKFAHIMGIMIWSAGLVCLPGLYVQRANVASGPSLHQLQRLVRFLYVAAISPAAFVAIGTGTALIFLRETWAPWFGAKLFFVGLMALIHILTGLVIIRLFDDGQIYPVWRFLFFTAVTVAIVAAILFLVLAKPDLAALLPAGLPGWLAEPGGLGRSLGDLSPFPRS